MKRKTRFKQERNLASIFDTPDLNTELDESEIGDDHEGGFEPETYES